MDILNTGDTYRFSPQGQSHTEPFGADWLELQLDGFARPSTEDISRRGHHHIQKSQSGLWWILSYKNFNLTLSPFCLSVRLHPVLDSYAAVNFPSLEMLTSGSLLVFVACSCRLSRVWSSWRGGCECKIFTLISQIWASSPQAWFSNLWACVN